MEENRDMFISKNLAVNEKGHLTIGGIDTLDLAKKYGTPLYVMDEDLIRENCEKFKKSIDDYYEKNGLVCYASKAFSCKEIYRIMKDEGLGVDVVSLGEMYTAVSAGFASEKIYLHGNNKTIEELKFAVEHKIGRIVVDNLNELELLNCIAKDMRSKVDVLIRVKPGIDAHTHDFIRTGQIDSKFGFAIETGEALSAAKLAVELDNINLVGAHCHIGSQILDVDPFVLAADVMIKFISDVKDATGIEMCELNLGGGFGIKYVDKDDPVDYEEYMKAVSIMIQKKCDQYNLNRPFIVIEPGRSLIAPTGITLYTVGARKEIPNIRTYVSVDGGMTDNPRYALYKSEYDAIVASKASEEKNEIVTIAGKCCESGDLIGENMLLQHAETGDILAVCATGAYNYSMASNYNRNLKPAVVMIKDGKSRVIVNRETLEDLVKNDI